MSFLTIEHYSSSFARSRRKMLLRRGFFACFVAVVPLFIFAYWLLDTKHFLAQAQSINEQITYQGKVADSSGISLANGAYNFYFELYSVASGGSPVWAEAWTSTTTAGSVTVSNGTFTVALGTSTSLSTVNFASSSLYLQVYFDEGSDGSFDETFTPRKRLTASPYAFNADKLDGLTAADFISTSTYSLPNIGSIGSSTATTTIEGNLDVVGFINVSENAGYMQDGLVVLKATATNASIAIGHLAGGVSDVGGFDNTAVGHSALFANTTGDLNVAIGSGALENNTIGGENVAVGFDTMNSNISGGRNSVVGVEALYYNIDGDYNSVLGWEAMLNNITGNNNSAVGAYSLYNNQSATNTVAIGYEAARGTASYSNQNGVYLGYQAGYSAQTGSNDNTFVGYQAGYSNTTGANNQAFGSGALYTNTASNNNAFGSSALNLNTSGTSNNAFGNLSLTANTTGQGNSAFGGNSLQSNTTGSNNVSIGQNSLNMNSSATTTVAIGAEAAAGTGSYSNQNGVYIGYQAGYSADTGSDENTFVGYQAGYGNTTGSLNTAVGGQSLSNNTTGVQNVAVGRFASVFNTTGQNNSSIGVNALLSSVTGSDNVALGWSSSYYNNSATNTIAIGSYAGYGVSNYSNQGGVVIGYQAGFNFQTGSNNNTFIGNNAGFANTTGANNILLGYQAGNNITTGSNNLVIGYDIDAPSATGSNQLNIGNLLFGTSIDGTGTTLSSGNIGIGTSTPQYTLAVDGDVGFQGTNWATTTIGQYDAYFEFGAFDILGFKIPQITPQTNISGAVQGIWDGTLALREANNQNPKLAFGNSDISVSAEIIYATTTENLDFDGFNYITVDKDGTDVFYASEFTDTVGVGTSTPYGTFAVSGNGTVGVPILNIADGASVSKFVIDENGLVGIGTTTPWRTLSVTGTVAFDGLTSNNGVTDDLCIDPVTKEVVQNTGATTCVVSSQKYKHDIYDLTYDGMSALEKINTLRPVSYKDNNTDQENLGFIAEEVFTVDPRLVFMEPGTTTDPRGVKYEQLTSLLVKGIQEIWKSIQEIWEKLTAQDDKIQELENRIIQLEQVQGMTPASSGSYDTSGGSSSAGGGGSVPAPVPASEPMPVDAGGTEMAPTEDLTPAPEPSPESVSEPSVDSTSGDLGSDSSVGSGEVI